MHPTILAKRNAIAQSRLVAATQTLAERFSLPTGESVPASVREPAVRGMLERESMADLLESIAQATAPKPKPKRAPRRKATK